jgi:CRISPR system Cascade subunit CasA
VWRHSAELLVVDVRAEGRNRQRPRALSQLAELAEYGHIPLDAVYTLRVFGQQLDSKASVVEAWFEEEVPAPVALLRARDERVGALIGRAVTLADDAGSALRSLQDQFRKELGAQPVSDIDVAYWPRLPAPFAVFLRDVADAHLHRSSEEPVVGAWARHVRRCADEVAQRWVSDAGVGARSMLALGRHHDLFLRRLGEAVHDFRATAATHIMIRETSV